MTHDPSAWAILDSGVSYPDGINADGLLDSLTAANLAVIKVGQVPPWMKKSGYLTYIMDPEWKKS